MTTGNIQAPLRRAVTTQLLADARGNMRRWAKLWREGRAFHDPVQMANALKRAVLWRDASRALGRSFFCPATKVFTLGNSPSPTERTAQRAIPTNELEAA